MTAANERLARRRRALGIIGVLGSGLLGASLSSRPGSTRFYVLTTGVAGTWAGGALCCGHVHLGPVTAHRETVRHLLVVPVTSGVAAFGVFYLGALVARRIPILDDELARVLRFADEGSSPLVTITTLTNGIAEEMFFRGALYAALDERHAIPASTALYLLATTTTRNPTLVLASGAMGVLLALLRRWSGGVVAPAVTHVTWSALMVRYLPSLFRPQTRTPVRGDRCRRT